MNASEPTNYTLKPGPLMLINGIGFTILTFPPIMANMWWILPIWIVPALLCFGCYFNYKVELNEKYVEIRNFIRIKHRVFFSDVLLVRKTKLNSIIIKGSGTSVTILHMFKDPKRIVDYIVKRVDKSAVSVDLLSEWSQYYCSVL